jgi:7-cyano-7-deazaguanine synthase in queuosine biosynthesis
MNKKILQTVSGGFDSTALLLKNLENHDHVYPVYVMASSVNHLKQNIELFTVKELITKMRVNNPYLHELEIIPMHFNNIPGLYSVQPILWILGLLTEAKRSYIHYEEAQIAYIMNDDTVSLLKEARNLWKSLFAFSTRYSSYTMPKLRFPLIFEKKFSIINYLEKHNDILYNCWTCETPRVLYERRLADGGKRQVIGHCGNCLPCTKIKEHIAWEYLAKYERTEDSIGLEAGSYRKLDEKEAEMIVKRVQAKNKESEKPEKKKGKRLA